MTKIKVLRYDRRTRESRYDLFEVESATGLTVLDALFYIQSRLDDSIAFRYSCRGAVCGSCAMLINNEPRLACRTQLSSLADSTSLIDLKPYPAIDKDKPWNRQEEILVEPLPHLPVFRDLVVDMSKFFEFYRVIEPVFKPDGKPPEKERLMDPSAARELEKYTNCILCALCFGSCPVNSREPEYLGPAALANLYRFHIDPREPQDESRLLLANNPSGWWRCEFHGNCTRVCPKGVSPTLAIAGARQKLEEIGRTPEESTDRR